MDKRDFLKPKPKQPAGAVLNFPMEIDRELVAEKLDALTNRIEVNVAEQLTVLTEAVKRIEDAIAKMPKWEKQEYPEPKEVDLTPLIEAINRPRKKTITAKRGEHGLIDLNSVIITEK